MSAPKEIDLHALVRDAVARHLSAGPADVPAAPHAAAQAAVQADASHQIYITLVNGDDACVIEPGVACTHCEYCRSHGH